MDFEYNIYLRSDNGGEYISRSFRDYCKTTGIVQQFTAPYTPQQNGISERDGRTIMDMTRCLLNEANLAKHLWGEVAATAVFLMNRLPHTAIGGDTPYYRMFGKQANLSFLRIIGTRAFVHEEGYRRKLQEKAWEGVLIGYDNDRPTFRVYDRTTGRIVSSRNVSFIEKSVAITPTTTAMGENNDINEEDNETNIKEEHQKEDYKNINDGITLLETINPEIEEEINADKTSQGSSSTMRLRSSGSTTTSTPDTNKNITQSRALQQLALNCYQETTHTLLESFTQYIGTVGFDNVLPPAAISVPNTYAQAMNSPQSNEWEKAMRKELNSLDEHEVADLIPSNTVPPGSSVIGTRWVFRVKADGRFKARLVVQGWAQQHGIDCFTTFAPVCRLSSQRLLLAIAASRDWPVIAMDVQTAFLNGKLQENVYTKQEPGFEKINTSTGQPFVMKLRKSLYGLRQSPNVWNNTMDNDLRKMGFTPTVSDPCVYTKGQDASYTMLTLFVDDLLITGPSDETVNNKAKYMFMSTFAMSDLGKVTQILGIEINRNRKAGTIELTQTKYTISMLKHFNTSNCNPVHTPGTGKELKSQPDGSTLLDEEATKEYQAIVGSLRG